MRNRRFERREKDNRSQGMNHPKDLKKEFRSTKKMIFILRRDFALSGDTSGELYHPKIQSRVEKF